MKPETVKSFDNLAAFRGIAAQEEELTLFYENYLKPAMAAADKSGDYSLIILLAAMARADEARIS